MLFKELLSVRYRAAMEKKTPLFRTLQWSWFCLGLFYTHGDSIVQYMEQQTADIPHIDVMEKAVNTISFAVFTACFVLSVLTLRPGLYKYQVRHH
jgi:phosphatidate cytidylyltransferase